MVELLDPDDQPPVPRRLICPVLDCDGVFELTDDLEPGAPSEWAVAHQATHTANDYLNTIAVLREEIRHLKSSLRGAAMMKVAESEKELEVPGLLVAKENKPGDTRIIDGKPATLVGRRLPDHIARDMKLPERGKGRRRKK